VTIDKPKSAKRQARAKAQPRVGGRFAGPPKTVAGAPVEPDAAPASAPVAGAVKRVRYRQPGAKPARSKKTPSEQAKPEPLTAPLAGEAPPASGDDPPAGGEPPVDDAPARPRSGFLAGMAAPMIGGRRV
jgi:hypothetical protein